MAFDKLLYFYHNEHCDGETDRPHGACALIISLGWASKRVRYGEERFLTLDFLPSSFRRSCCTDPRDAVYSLVSVPTDMVPDTWLPDYWTDNDELMVFKKAFEYIVHVR